MKLEIGNAGLCIGRGEAGAVTAWCGMLSIHLLVWRAFWVWGYSKDWYDGYLYSFGLGPLVAVTYADV